MSKLKYKATERYIPGWTDPRVDMRVHPDALVRQILRGQVPPEIRAEMVHKVV